MGWVVSAARRTNWPVDSVEALFAGITADVGVQAPVGGLSGVIAGGGGGMPGGDITHGEQLDIYSDPGAIDYLGPWALQGVEKGSEVLQTISGPGRGYFTFGEPTEFCPSGAWPSNANDDNPSILNDPDLHGGVVTGSPVMIDGVSIPVGTYICQFRILPDGYDFYARETNFKVLFRGCRARWNSGVGGTGLFNDSGAGSGQQIAFGYSDVGLNSLDPPNGSEGLMHMKFLGGSNHRIYRNYWTNSQTFIQPNVSGVQIYENLITGYIFAYGEKGTSGAGPDSTTAHLNGISGEGGMSSFKALRNAILCQSPDGATGSSGSSAGQIGYGTQSGQVGYGSGSAPGRLTIQTDCIAVGTAGSNNGGEVRDNLVGGSGFCFYIGAATTSNYRYGGNKVTTRWWTNGGNGGAVTQLPTWGTNGMVTDGDNVWADDYGTGGNGSTATSGRQYPAGDGPRAGTVIF